MNGEYNGYRTLDVTIPAGALTPSGRIQLSENETFVAVISPSDWVTSDVHAQVTHDNGDTWEWMESGANTKQPYFVPTQASRVWMIESALSHVSLTDFKLASASDQLSPKTLTLLIMDR